MAHSRQASASHVASSGKAYRVNVASRSQQKRWSQLRGPPSIPATQLSAAMMPVGPMRVLERDERPQARSPGSVIVHRDDHSRHHASVSASNCIGFVAGALAREMGTKSA